MAIVAKHLFRKYSIILNLNLHRTIMTSASRCEKAVEELKKNPYFEKYAQKIATLQQTSPEEFLSRIEEHDKSKSKSKFGGTKERQYTSLLSPKESLETAGVTDRKLNDIMKVDSVKDMDSQEITRIWAAYHLQKDFIAATIPDKVYEKILSRSAKYPTFIFPLPRSEGFEFFMCQFMRNSVYFTPLICYQVHKENAPECLTMVHYTELKEDKQIVLMRGEFNKDVLDAKEAQCLANQLQLYYGQDNESKLKLLDVFTNKPDEFKHMNLISELENIPL